MLLKLNLQRFASETWLLNETDLSQSLIGQSFTINFQSNSTTYSKISFQDKYSSLLLLYDDTEVYVEESFNNSNYRTITFETAPTGNLLSWLQANGTKQATEITYTCKWYLDGTLVNTSTFTHEKLTGVDYYALGSVFKVMLSAETLAQYDYGVNLNSETSNASLGTDNVITIEAFKGNIVFNITTNGKTTLATKNTYVPSDIDFNVNVPSAEAIEEVSTSSAMTAKLVESNVGKYYKYTGTTDDTYTNGDIYLVQGE